MHGGAAPDEIRGFVREDLGADTVEIWECGACGLEFARPHRTWRAAHYPHERHQLAWDHEEALRELAGIAPVALLDVGCADGQFLTRAGALGHRVTGVDFSDEDVAAARALGHEAYAADLSRENALVEGERRFDAITLFQVIEHLEEPDLVFAGLSKLAAPGATLMLGCPSSRRYTRGFDHPERVGSSDFWDAPPQHVLRWSPAALTAFLARHGWRVERTAFEPLVPYHAAAHLAGLGQFAGSAWRRRMGVLQYWARLKMGKCTGIRLFALARREGPAA
jgi:SAM-dependent methyltransferase